jgi:hypothetical protein
MCGAPSPDRVGKQGTVATHQILGQDVNMPVLVRDATAATVMYDVELAAAQRLAPPGFDVIETERDRAQFALALIDYRDNDLGSYLEIGTILFVRPAGDGPDGTFITHLPVDEQFSCAAGNDIWGFPKTVETIELTLHTESARWELVMDGELVLDLTIPRGGTDEFPPMDMTSYSMLHGRPHATSFSQGGTGAAIHVDPSLVSLKLGEHPLAKELASLGLPAAPAFITWIEHMQGSFGDAYPIS